SAADSETSALTGAPAWLTWILPVTVSPGLTRSASSDTSTSSRLCALDTASSTAPSLNCGRLASPSPWRPDTSAIDANTFGARAHDTLPRRSDLRPAGIEPAVPLDRDQRGRRAQVRLRDEPRDVPRLIARLRRDDRHPVAFAAAPRRVAVADHPDRARHDDRV